MNFYILVFLILFNSIADNKPGPKTEMAGNVVFRSTDGGQTWQDISKGLPENLQLDGIRGNSFFVNDKGLFLKVGSGLSHSTSNATGPFWTKEIFTDQNTGDAPGKSREFYWGVNLKRTNGASVWSPIFENFHEPRIRTVFETAGGTIFIGIDRGFFRSTDNGKTWKHVYTGGLVGHLAESNGVLVATSMRKVIRSTDNGENWALATSEDSVTWDVKPINGGFVAITAGSESGTRRLSKSYDGGKTWKSFDSGLQNKVLIDSIWRTWNDRPRVQSYAASIFQVGKSFLCTHPDGIFRSSDNGNTWKLLLPLVENKGFNLFFSGKVIYAIPSKGGC